MAHSQGTMLSLPLKRDKPLLMIMDGHAMVHRAFHAISTTQSLTTRDGEDTTAVFGFSNTFLRAINDLHPTHCIIAFDTSQPTFRHEMFPEYKAQRPPDTAGPQAPVRPRQTANGSLQHSPPGSPWL